MSSGSSSGDSEFSGSGRFVAAINKENSGGKVAVIPDIKLFSPKEGDLLRGRDPVVMAKLLVRCGAPALSVVTERERFKGSANLLRHVAYAVDVPVLRKDFITEESDLVETVEMGARAVLLICAVTDRGTIGSLYEKALKLGLEPFVEVCSEAEMKFASELGASFIGINNRDISILEKDDGGPSRTVELISCSPENAVVVSESGILSPHDAMLAASAGANAVLVGTALWRADDIEAMYRSLRVERGSAACAQS